MCYHFNQIQFSAGTKRGAVLSLNQSNDCDYSTGSKRFDTKWLIFSCAIVIAALLSRLLFLDDKPFHHDESLHGYYSNRVAQGHPHEYSALLHGPVLYYLTGAFMAVFGTGELQSRLPAALCGVGLVLLPLFWGRALGKAAAAAIAIFALTSPTLMYFGRFLREDAFNTFWILACLASFCGFFVSRKPRYAVLSAVFLALQFCNKENSYLHLFIWLSGFYVSLRLMDCSNGKCSSLADLAPQKHLERSDALIVILNCAIVFSSIFILFYSSFFRHPKGALHGMLDGLYRESLLYWWDQNQKRRIDGPFDYHIPIFLNYEFALVPALVFAWLRMVRQAAAAQWQSRVAAPLRLFRKPLAVLGLFVFSFGLLMLPRVGLSPEGCSISEYCLAEVLEPQTANPIQKVAQILHIAHSRHFVQLILMIVFGALAFLASTQLRRLLDSFLWWWLTGAVGVYSYVGEKVPWLLMYIVLPAVILAGLEVGRQLDGSARMDATSESTKRAVLEQGPRGIWSLDAVVVRWLFLAATLALVGFATFKAIRASFVRPESPHERLVFTQTTPAIKKIRDRWAHAMRREPGMPKISISGDATWPMSWYGYDINGLSFTPPKDATEAEGFDAVFLDRSELSFAYNNMNSFDIYEVALRHWWVPQPNPAWNEILDYFLTGRPYPRELRDTPVEQGIGDTTVLYLENRQTGRFFAKAGPCGCGRELRAAR
jgi:uncharacterized protein (TIGR03663 family)